MAAVTKNRNFFNCPLLLYYKSKWAQIFTAATWKWVVIIYSRFFCEIFLSADLYRLCKLGIFWSKITFKSFPLKPLNQIKPNLAGMVLGWVTFSNFYKDVVVFWQLPVFWFKHFSQCCVIFHGPKYWLLFYVVTFSKFEGKQAAHQQHVGRHFVKLTLYACTGSCTASSGASFIHLTKYFPVGWWCVKKKFSPVGGSRHESVG